MHLYPYLNLGGNAKEAMQFYQKVFGGKLSFTTYKEGQASPDASYDEKIMHSSLVADDGKTIFAADAPPGTSVTKGNEVSLSLILNNDNLGEEVFNKIVDGGKTYMAFGRAPWGDLFGMGEDKFGIRWLVNVGPGTNANEP